MALKNLEEALVERIQRSIARELRRLWRVPLVERRNGDARHADFPPTRRRAREIGSTDKQ